MTQIKSGITINVNVSAKIQKKKHHTCKKKNYIWRVLLKIQQLRGRKL